MSQGIYKKQNPESIQMLFSSIAKNYDLGNSLMSFRLHRSWNKTLVHALSQKTKATTILDLCSGTGAITEEWLKAPSPPRKIHCLDFCSEMLAVAKNKVSPPKHIDIRYIEGDAQKIPLKNDSVHAISLAYGIRNIANPDLCIQEAFRVLKPGGFLGILELTRPENKLLAFFHKLYLRTFIPTVGRCLCSNKEAYSYLSSSIEHFIPPKTLQESLKKAGFAPSSTHPLHGGTAHIILGKKPSQ